MERDGEATFKHTAIKKSVVLSVTYHRFTSICRLKFKYIISSSEVNQTNNVPFLFLSFYYFILFPHSTPPPPHHHIKHTTFSTEIKLFRKIQEDELIQNNLKKKIN